MIKSHHLISFLVKNKKFKTLERSLKKEIALLPDYKPKTYYRFFVYANNNRIVFNHIIVMMFYLHNLSIEPFFDIINNFNMLIVSLLPTFNSKNKPFFQYQFMQELILKRALNNQEIKEWYEETNHKNEELGFILNSKSLPYTIKNKLQILTNITGQLWVKISFEQKALETEYYNFGFYLMLYFILDCETRQLKRLQTKTDWNLNLHFGKEELFSYKLSIIEKLNKSLMLCTNQNFNLYWRVINKVLTKSYE